MKSGKTDIQEQFVAFLDQKMKEKGMGLRELARKADISPSYISHLKTFKTTFHPMRS